MTAPGGKRLVNSKSGLKILCQHDKDASPWELAEPQWTLDAEVRMPKMKLNVSYRKSCLSSCIGGKLFKLPGEIYIYKSKGKCNS